MYLSRNRAILNFGMESVEGRIPQIEVEIFLNRKGIYGHEDRENFYEYLDYLDYEYLNFSSEKRKKQQDKAKRDDKKEDKKVSKK